MYGSKRTVGVYLKPRGGGRKKPQSQFYVFKFDSVSSLSKRMCNCAGYRCLLFFKAFFLVFNYIRNLFDGNLCPGNFILLFLMLSKVCVLRQKTRNKIFS